MQLSPAFTHLLVRNQIANFEVWHEGFSQHEPVRHAAGLHELALFRNVDRPEECFVLFETSDAEKTKAFIHSPALSEFKKSLGVLAKPEYIFVEKSSAKGDLPARSTGPVLERVLAAQAKIDELDASGFAEAFGQKGEFQFANFPPLVGPVAVQQFVSSFFSQLRSIAHEVQDQFEVGNTASIRGRVHYGMKDGRNIELPYSSFYRLGVDGKFDLWQAFVDTSPLSSRE